MGKPKEIGAAGNARPDAPENPLCRRFLEIVPHDVVEGAILALVLGGPLTLAVVLT